MENNLQELKPSEGQQPSEKKNMISMIKELFKKPILKKIGLCLVLVLIISCAAYVSSWRTVENSFATQYRLVPEKVSKSATIKISLPAGTDVAQAMQSVRFDPAIEGNWIEEKTVSAWGVVFASEKENESIEFKPSNQLAVNRYYNVYLDIAEGNSIKADFLAVEDPVIEAVFPNGEEEAPEDSKITVVFSRPIVPLTTIDALEGQAIPIEITPATKGKYRWISTNTLQFQPDEELIPSANYTVKVKDGFISLDGVSISGGEFHFMTRNLRYLNSREDDSKTAIYNEPVKIHFNQPVDLRKTAEEIELLLGGEKTSFHVSYGKKQKAAIVASKEEFGLDAFGNFFNSTVDSINPISLDVPKLEGAGLIDDVIDAETDTSVIMVYNKVDQAGRNDFWNLKSEYLLSIKKAYPLNGDIILDSPKTIRISTTDIYESIYVSSERTRDSSKEMFDPQGSLIYSFYEEVDLDKTRISASAPIKTIAYGEKCSDDNLSIDSSACEKVPDRKILIVTFDYERVSVGSVIETKAKEVYNSLGQKINIDERVDNLQTYRALEVRLGKNDYRNNTTQLVLCSNNPLSVPEEKDFKERIKANLDYEVFYWNTSFKDTYVKEDGTRRYCSDGSFATLIDVGLMPEENYETILSLTDVFGQSIVKGLDFKTGVIEDRDISIFKMQQDYSVTSPDEVILSFGAKNIDYVNVEICKMADIADFYKAYDRYSSSYWDERYSFPDCLRLDEYEIQLPKKYWKNNYFDIDLRKYFGDVMGNYIIKVSHPDYKRYDEEVIDIFSFVNVTNLAVGQKNVELRGENIGDKSLFGDLKNIYWVTDMSTQEPIVGARVVAYNGKEESEGVTDEKGLALIEPIPSIDAVLVKYGNDSTVIREYGDDLNYASGVYSVKKSYIYTDRPIYRPGDKVNIKGILRIGYDGNYQTSDKTAKVVIKSPRWENVFEQEVSLNEFGTFLTSYDIGSDAPLGSYSICTNDYDCSYFNILEYVPAAFEVKASTSKDDFVSKEDVKIDIDANYYFGVPVDNAEVEYVVSSQNYYFDRVDDWSYNFDYYDQDYYYSDDYYYGDRYLFRGKTTLDGNGKGSIVEKMDLDKLFKNSKSSKIIVFDINVKNSFGQNVSYQKSIILHAGEFYLGSSVSPYFVQKDKGFNLKVKSVDVNGKNKKVDNLNIRIYRVEWEYSKRQNSFGSYDYNWEQKLELAKTLTGSTDNDGNYSNEGLKLDKEGSYEVQVSATDSKGNTVYSNSFMYVHGSGVVRVRHNDDTNLEIRSVKDKLKEGETGEIIIESPYPKAKALITIERGRVFEYEVVDVIGGIYSYKFRADKKYAPNVYISVLLHSPDPQVRFASKSFSIDSEANKINMEISLDKKNYSPGEEVKMKVTTKDSDSRGVKAEVSFAVVDASVLALMGNPKKDPMAFFYDGFPLTVSTASNVRNIIVKKEKTSTKGGSGGGSEDSGKNTPRGEFKDTAFWKGDVLTNEDGVAEISFKLPDNLTRWQVEAVGITADTKLGVAYTDFVTRKELMVVPLKPRFIIPGDSFTIGAKIFNQSDKKQKVRVSFSSGSLVFQGGNQSNVIDMEKGESKQVYFPVKAPDNVASGVHAFVVSAEGEGVSDAVEQKIVIRSNTTYETVATSNYTTNESVTEAIYVPSNLYADKGEVTIRSSATLAVFLSNPINYLIQYPYGCSEQISSILKGLAVVERALNVPNVEESLELDKVRYDGEEYDIHQLVEIGMKKLFKNQNQDGGFSLWGNDSSSYTVSLKVLDALVELNKSGRIGDDDPRLQRLVSYVSSNFRDSKKYDDDEIVNAAFNLLQMPSDKDNSVVRGALERIVNDDKILKDELTNQSLAKLAILGNNGNFDPAKADSINMLLDNRLNIDGRGAFIEPRQERWFWYNYETSIGNTALYLRSLVSGQRETSNNDKVIRWLLNSRSKDGSWGSTQNNLAVIEAFIDFLNWKKETESEYDLDVSLNRNKVESYSFGAQNIFEQLKTTIPVNQLKSGDYNVVGFTKSKQRPFAKDSLYYDMSFKYYLAGDVDARSEGFTVTRGFYALDDIKNKNPLSSVVVGGVVRAHLEIIVPRERRFVLIEDYIPAGMEIVDMDLATEQKSLRFTETEVNNRILYPEFKELRDDRAVLYKTMLYPGVYEFDYFVRPLVKGNYFHLPAVVSEMYTPEIFGRTRSSYFEVRD